jgi:regulator of replication initiation timing
MTSTQSPHYAEQKALLARLGYYDESGVEKFCRTYHFQQQLRLEQEFRSDFMANDNDQTPFGNVEIWTNEYESKEDATHYVHEPCDDAGILKLAEKYLRDYENILPKPGAKPTTTVVNVNVRVGGAANELSPRAFLVTARLEWVLKFDELLTIQSKERISKEIEEVMDENVKLRGENERLKASQQHDPVVAIQQREITELRGENEMLLKGLIPTSQHSVVHEAMRREMAQLRDEIAQLRIEKDVTNKSYFLMGENAIEFEKEIAKLRDENAQLRVSNDALAIQKGLAIMGMKPTDTVGPTGVTGMQGSAPDSATEAQRADEKEECGCGCLSYYSGPTGPTGLELLFRQTAKPGVVCMEAEAATGPTGPTGLSHPGADCGSKEEVRQEKLKELVSLYSGAGSSILRSEELDDFTRAELEYLALDLLQERVKVLEKQPNRRPIWLTNLLESIAAGDVLRGCSRQEVEKIVCELLSERKEGPESVARACDSEELKDYSQAELEELALDLIRNKAKELKQQPNGRSFWASIILESIDEERMVDHCSRKELEELVCSFLSERKAEGKK